VTVTITQGSTTWASSGLIAIGGKTSVNYTFIMPPAGTYQVSANLLDGSGNTLATASTTFTIPTQTNPVVLTLPSALASANLASATLVATLPTGGPTTYALVPTFSPATYTYTSTSPEPEYAYPPTLTLTTVDSSATFSVTETVPGGTAGPYALLPAGSPSGSSCTLNFSADYSPATLTIVVTASDGVTTQTYTMTIAFSLG
jgi:hypothetical protein